MKISQKFSIQIISSLSTIAFFSSNFVNFAFAENSKSINKSDKTLSEILVISDSLKENSGYKANYSSSSTRTEAKILNTPQAVSVVNQDQIRDQNITSMEEAVRYVPGVNIQQGESNRDAITFRGNGSTADFFVDGARDDVQYYRDFYNIEKIEFLKGPNAMAFGRGGSGGLVNRVSKYADGEQNRRLVLTGGSFNNRRAEIDLGDKVNDKLAVRFNTMYEKSGTFRQYGDLERYGFNPTATLFLSKNTELRFGYEYFRDSRFNDRGTPSANGGAYKVNPKTFFGNPNENDSDAEVNSVYATLIHKFSDDVKIKNFTRIANYNKFYQNVFLNGSVQANGDIALDAYNNETDRNNFSNQTDLTLKFSTGDIKHELLVGSEIAHQNSKNLRQETTQSLSVNVNDPLDFTSIVYDDITVNNSSRIDILAGYLQDQIEINQYLQFVAGLRYERFDINLRDRRSSTNFGRTDNLLSPKVGIVVKPREDVSIYSSYSVSYLPSSGDQFTSLNSSTETLKPEELQNYEIGAKWDVTKNLNLAIAIFELNRSNTASVDPNNASVILPSGESRTRGIEIEARGKLTEKWQIISGFNHNEAEITSPYNSSTTSTIKAGNVLQLNPRNKFSLWNKYDFSKKFAAALGFISQSSQFAAADNKVRFKGFNRFDAALYYKINDSYRVQVNAENLFDREYILSAHNNNNLQPGSTRAFKASLVADF
jgi:catecholate siderophore receptor